jgi:hypothetical protein
LVNNTSKGYVFLICLEVIGRIVTVPENSLLLSLETTTTGLVLDISRPMTGSRAAR